MIREDKKLKETTQLSLEVALEITYTIGAILKKYLARVLCYVQTKKYPCTHSLEHIRVHTHTTQQKATWAK